MVQVAIRRVTCALLEAGSNPLLLRTGLQHRANITVVLARRRTIR